MIKCYTFFFLIDVKKRPMEKYSCHESPTRK